MSIPPLHHLNHQSSIYLLPNYLIPVSFLVREEAPHWISCLSSDVTSSASPIQPLCYLLTAFGVLSRRVFYRGCFLMRPLDGTAGSISSLPLLTSSVFSLEALHLRDVLLCTSRSLQNIILIGWKVASFLINVADLYSSLKTQNILAGVAQWIEHGLRTKVSPVRFPVRTHSWVVGQVPSRGNIRDNHTLMFLSFSLSLPSPLSKNK